MGKSDGTGEYECGRTQPEGQQCLYGFCIVVGFSDKDTMHHCQLVGCCRSARAVSLLHAEGHHPPEDYCGQALLCHKLPLADGE